MGSSLRARPRRLTWTREGSSKLNYLVERGRACVVLRRTRPPQLPRSPGNTVREARLPLRLAVEGVRVPLVLAFCRSMELAQA
jgi:hypothetical protein